MESVSKINEPLFEQDIFFIYPPKFIDFDSCPFISVKLYFVFILSSILMEKSEDILKIIVLLFSIAPQNLTTFDYFYYRFIYPFTIYFSVEIHGFEAAINLF